jgi:hypothetical protein
MLSIEFYSSGADPEVAALIEEHVRKATEALRCSQHFPGRVSSESMERTSEPSMLAVRCFYNRSDMLLGP